MKNAEIMEKIDQAQESLMWLYRDYVADGLKRVPDGDVLHVRTHVPGAPDTIWDYEVKRQGQEYTVEKKTLPLKDHEPFKAGVPLSTEKRTLDGFLKWDIWFNLCAWEQLHDQIRFYDAMETK